MNWIISHIIISTRWSLGKGIDTIVFGKVTHKGMLLCDGFVEKVCCCLIAQFKNIDYWNVCEN